MPRVSSFYGIKIEMYYSEHPPPHFHAKYAEFHAQVRIDTLEIIEGDLPSRALSLVKEWTQLHREELYKAWEAARNAEPIAKIDPLV